MWQISIRIWHRTGSNLGRAKRIIGQFRPSWWHEVVDFDAWPPNGYEGPKTPLGAPAAPIVADFGAKTARGGGVRAAAASGALPVWTVSGAAGWAAVVASYRVHSAVAAVVVVVVVVVIKKNMAAF